MPSVRLQVSGAGTAEVAASAEVTGGRPPYTYSWVGSNPSLAASGDASVRYVPLTRVPASDRRLPLNETIGVNVTVAERRDGHGKPDHRGSGAADRGRVRHIGPSHGGGASYGCESPGEPEMWTQERVGWQQGMANPGGGTQKFCWLGNASWPGDYIKPAKPGTLPAKPWIYGDIDYGNWGVNTANLVLIQARPGGLLNG